MPQFGPRGISYTPSFSQGMATMGRAFAGRRAEKYEDERAAHESQLAKDAWMGNPEAIQDLAEVNPELAMKIETQSAQRKATEEQRGLDTDVRFKTDMESIMGQIGNFQTFEEAQGFGQRMTDMMVEKYPERVQQHGMPTEFNQEAFNQIRSITGADIPKDPIKLGERLIDPDTYEILVGETEEPVGFLETKDRIKIERDFRNDFIKQSGDFIIQNDAYGRIIASAEDPSAAGDLSLTFAYMKLQDPNSVVRESEFKTAAAARGMLQEAEEGGEYVPAFIYAIVEKAMAGTSMTPVQRADFVKRAGMLYGDAAGLHKDREDEFKRIADVNKLNAKIIVGDTLIRDIGGAASAAPEVGEVVDGYEFTGGDPSDESSWKKL